MPAILREREFMKRFEYFRKFFAFLKKTNGSDTSGAGLEATNGIFGGNAADGDHRNIHGLANASQTVQALRRPVIGFGWRKKDRAEIDVIGASPGSAQGRAERVARKTNQKVVFAVPVREIFIAQPAGFGNRNSVLAKVHAAGTAGQCDIEAIIHENAG